MKDSQSIEEIVSRLRTEANRLHIRKTDRENADQVHSLVNRLQEMATMLLRKADYIAIMNADGQISYANGAFLSLLLPETEVTEAPDQRSHSKRAEKERLERQRTWEATLNNSSPGITRFPDPVSGAAGGKWVLQRTIIEDEITKKEAAYLNVLRHANSQRLPTGTLAKLEPFLSELTFYASMYAYGSEKPASEALEKLDTLIAKMYKAAGFRKS